MLDFNTFKTFQGLATNMSFDDDMFRRSQDEYLRQLHTYLTNKKVPHDETELPSLLKEAIEAWVRKKREENSDK